MPLYGEHDASFRRLLADKVGEGVRDGSVRADAAPEAVAVSLVGILRGSCCTELRSTSRTRQSDVDEAARFIRLALGPRHEGSTHGTA